MIHMNKEKTQTPPSQDPIRADDPQISPQRSKTTNIQRFGKNISKLMLSINTHELYIIFLHVVSYEVVAQLNVFSSRVLDWILSNTYRTSVIAEKWNRRNENPKVL